MPSCPGVPGKPLPGKPKEDTSHNQQISLCEGNHNKMKAKVKPLILAMASNIIGQGWKRGIKGIIEFMHMWICAEH